MSLSRKTMKRIKRDLREWHKGPVAGCAVELVDENLSTWRVALTCPASSGAVDAQSVWRDTACIVQLEFPDGYPQTPPAAFFLTRIPFTQGGVATDDRGWQYLCLSLLGGTFATIHDEWAADTTHGWNPVIGSAKLVITMLQALLYQEEAIDPTSAARCAEAARNFNDAATGHFGSDRERWWPAVSPAASARPEPEEGGAGASGSATSAGSFAANGIFGAPKPVIRGVSVDDRAHQKLDIDRELIAGEMLCYASRARFDEDDTVLGFGVLLEHVKGGKINISTPCELLSAASFLDDSVRETTQRKAISHYFPIFIDEEHWSRARGLFEAAMKQIADVKHNLEEGEPAEISFAKFPWLNSVHVARELRRRRTVEDKRLARAFGDGGGALFQAAISSDLGRLAAKSAPSSQRRSGSGVKRSKAGRHRPIATFTHPAMKVLPRLINLTVVSLNNGELHCSEHLLLGLTQLFRVLLQVALENPTLRDQCDARVRSFVEGATTKKDIPDLGEFLVALALAPSFDWREVIPIYLKESFVRNVRWAAMKHPELGRCSEREKLIHLPRGPEDLEPAEWITCRNCGAKVLRGKSLILPSGQKFIEQSKCAGRVKRVQSYSVLTLPSERGSIARSTRTDPCGCMYSPEAYKHFAALEVGKMASLQVSGVRSASALSYENRGMRLVHFHPPTIAIPIENLLFKVTKTSRGLICFQKFFLEHIARPSEFHIGTDGTSRALASLSEVADELDDRFGRPADGEVEALQDAWRRIKGLKSWEEFYAELGHPAPSPDELRTMFADAAATSRERGYHRCPLTGAEPWARGVGVATGDAWER